MFKEWIKTASMTLSCLPCHFHLLAAGWQAVEERGDRRQEWIKVNYYWNTKRPVTVRVSPINTIYYSSRRWNFLAISSCSNGRPISVIIILQIHIYYYRYLPLPRSKQMYSIHHQILPISQLNCLPPAILFYPAAYLGVDGRWKPPPHWLLFNWYLSSGPLIRITHSGRRDSTVSSSFAACSRTENAFPRSIHSSFTSSAAAAASSVSAYQFQTMTIELENVRSYCKCCFA